MKRKEKDSFKLNLFFLFTICFYQITLQLLISQTLCSVSVARGGLLRWDWASLLPAKPSSFFSQKHSVCTLQTWHRFVKVFWHLSPSNSDSKIWLFQYNRLLFYWLNFPPVGGTANLNWLLWVWNHRSTRQNPYKYQLVNSCGCPSGKMGTLTHFLTRNSKVKWLA